MSSNPIMSSEWPSAWVRDKTYVRFFDEDGKDVAVIDGVTGMGWVLENGQEGDGWILDESVFPAARWVFDATFVVGNGDGTPPGFRSLHEESNVPTSDGSGYAELVAGLMAREDSPWEYPGSPKVYTTYAERESRLNVCRACPLYNHAEGTCAVDGDFMPNKTTVAVEVCPEGKWGQPEGFDPAQQEARTLLAQTMTPNPVNSEEQAAFEAEWEARNVR